MALGSWFVTATLSRVGGSRLMSWERVSDDLDPVFSVSGFGRLSWVGTDGGLTGAINMLCFRSRDYLGCCVV